MIANKIKIKRLKTVSVISKFHDLCFEILCEIAEYLSNWKNRSLIKHDDIFYQRLPLYLHLNDKYKHKIEIIGLNTQFREKCLNILLTYYPWNNLYQKEIHYYMDQMQEPKLIIGDFNAHHPNWNPGLISLDLHICLIDWQIIVTGSHRPPSNKIIIIKFLQRHERIWKLLNEGFSGYQSELSKVNKNIIDSLIRIWHSSVWNNQPNRNEQIWNNFEKIY